MRNLTIIILLVALSVGCNNKELPKGTDQVKNVDSSRSVPRQTITYSNPSFMAGSTFLNYFMALLRVQNYADAIRFTAPSNVQKHGTSAILSLYENFKISYSPVLKSVIKLNDSEYTMRYVVNQLATKRFKDIKVLIVDDTARLVLPDRLDEFLK